ncbi:MAG: TetR/AcrR family transcriptional regulator, partial [Planctomycetota bacterium]|nr:TetR/AcrR family transcriptional regulator [Planctomycetota bacterium]
MPSTTRKPTRVRRREIAEAALRVIGERGAPSLTAATLAAEVGLTPGALFRHFASVDEILCEAVEVAVEALERTFPPAAAPPLERLRRLALERIALVTERPGYSWLLLSDQVSLCVPDAAVERLRELVRRSRTFLMRAFEDGVASGALRSDVPPQTMLVLFTGTVHSLIAAGGVHREAASPAAPRPVIGALLALLENPS